MRTWLLLVALAGCDFPSRSEAYACETTADCTSNRVCDQGYCVIGSGAGMDSSRLDTILPSDGPNTVTDAPPDADPFVAIASQCVAQGYTLVAGPAGYYRPVTVNATWLNAQADCANDVAGATHLIVLSTPAESTYMLSRLGWIGLSDRITEGTFVTVTGETGDQRPFSAGQPDNGNGNENCVQMKADGLDDDQCGNTHRYVCECDGRASPP